MSRFFAIMITAVIANPYLLIVVVIIMLVFFLFRWYFLKSAREVKRIEALGVCVCVYVCVCVSVCLCSVCVCVSVCPSICMSVCIRLCYQYCFKTFLLYFSVLLVARSPLYSHISMTLQGLSTIRAYRRQSDNLELFHEYQNYHTQAWYIYIVSSR